METTSIYEQNIRAWLNRKNGIRRALNEGGTYASKCLGRGTRIIMSNLTLRAVEDIRVGDALMGIDGKPRKVLKLYSGRDELYRVKQARGIDYVVSNNHILSLKENWREIRRTVRLTELGVKPRKQKRVYVRNEHTNEVTNISLPEYQVKSDKWKRRHKGWKLAGIELKERPVKIEPYFLGLWLGDGTSGMASITNSDKPIIEYLKWFAMRSGTRYVKMNTDAYGHRLSKTSGRSNPLWEALKTYGILNNKRIPQAYLNNSKTVRLALLAGLVDSDGYKSKNKCLVITQVRKELAEDILMLVRSLGCSATWNCNRAKMKCKDGTIYEVDNYRVEFVGEVLNQLPVKLERKRIYCPPLPRRYSSSIEVEPVGEGDYFGFELDGDHLFLLEDFTVTHNTWSILQLLYLIATYSRQPLLISIVSESLPHLKKGAIRDFFDALGESQDNNPKYNKTDHIYSTGISKIEFFGADEADKVRGPRRDILFINEANNVPWETARGLDIRTRLFTFADWNPVSEFWAHENWIGKPENVYIHSTYLDAKDVLPPEVIKNIESNKSDPNWWNIYGLGRIGKIEGLVYPYFEQIDTLPSGDYFYGLDFGYSNDKTALIKNIILGGALYSQELIYESGLTNQDIGYRLSELGLQKNLDEIFADSSEPKSIEEIYRQGFNIKPCPKGPGSVEYGHQKVRQYKQYWTKDSTNCIKEQRNFRYIQDKNGNLTDKTTHVWSHCLIAGTSIKTRRGDIPIEQVNTNDFVLTREGWQKVRASGMVSPKTEVQTVVFSNQSSITGTPNHLVYVNGKGYSPLHTLRYGDIIEVCQGEKELNIMASGILDTQTPKIGQIGIITVASRMGAKIGISIGKCGWMCTALSQTGLKFIIRIITPLIIMMRTLSAYLSQSIITNILYQSGDLNGCENALMLSAPNLLNGTNQQMVENGIKNTELQSIKREFPETANVSFAGRFIKHFLVHHGISSVLTNVNQHIEGRRGQIISPEPVNGAVENSQLTNMTIRKLAPVYVLSVSGVHQRKQPVFDLTIDGYPEFYANSILVHNSMDARRYGIMGKVEPPEPAESLLVYDALSEVERELML